MGAISLNGVKWICSPRILGAVYTPKWFIANIGLEQQIKREGLPNVISELNDIAANPVFFMDLYNVFIFKSEWTYVTDCVDFSSVLHGLQMAEYSA